MAHRDLKHWAVAFDTAALEFLAGRFDLFDPAGLTWEVRPCPRHGAGCAAVTYGALLAHVWWAEKDPARLARRLLATMLPDV